MFVSNPVRDKVTCENLGKGDYNLYVGEGTQLRACRALFGPY